MTEQHGDQIEAHPTPAQLRREIVPQIVEPQVTDSELLDGATKDSSDTMGERLPGAVGELGLIYSRGHIARGGYCVPNGSEAGWSARQASPVHG